MVIILLAKVKVININVKVILWIWKGHFWIRKGYFCIVCQKVGVMATLLPGPYVPEYDQFVIKSSTGDVTFCGSTKIALGQFTGPVIQILPPLPRTSQPVDNIIDQNLVMSLSSSIFSVYSSHRPLRDAPAIYL